MPFNLFVVNIFHPYLLDPIFLFLSTPNIWGTTSSQLYPPSPSGLAGGESYGFHLMGLRRWTFSVAPILWNFNFPRGDWPQPSWFSRNPLNLVVSAGLGMLWKWGAHEMVIAYTRSWRRSLAFYLYLCFSCLIIFKVLFLIVLFLL